MKSTEKIASTSILNIIGLTGETAMKAKRPTVVEDLGLGKPSEENHKAASENAEKLAADLNNENKSLTAGIKKLVKGVAEIATQITKLEDEIKNGNLKQAELIEREKEIKQLKNAQKAYNNEIKDSQEQITLNTSAAQEAEAKAAAEDKKAEDAKAEAEDELVEAENKTEETEAAKDNETSENTENGQTPEAEAEVAYPPVEGIVVPETEESEEAASQTEIEDEVQEIIEDEVADYIDSLTEIIPEEDMVDETIDEIINEITYDTNDIVEKTEIAEIVEAVKTYEEIGVNVDVETLVKASATELDAIVETAVVQEVLKTTATGKKMGAIANITSKKEMKKNKEAADEFQANFITLQSYYNANNVYNAAAEGFIALGNEMYTNLAQGATYDTSKLNDVSNTALNLTSTIQNEVANSAVTANNTDNQYEETKTQAQNALDKAKDAVGEDQENVSLVDLEAEFLTITSNYRNATADSEKQETITDLLKIVTKANVIENNPESKVITDERLVVAL